MKQTDIPKWVSWVKKTADQSWFPIPAGAIVLADYFFPLLPSTAMVIASALVAPRKWFVNSIGCAIGSAIGAFIIAIIFQEYGWYVIEWLFGNLRNAPQWNAIHGAIAAFGLIALFIMSGLPMPLRVPTLITILAGTSPWIVFLIVLLGRCFGYSILGYFSSISPAKLLQFRLIRRSRLIRAFLEHPDQLKTNES